MRYKSFNEAIDKLNMFATYLNYETMCIMIQYVSALFNENTEYIEGCITWRD